MPPTRSSGSVLELLARYESRNVTFVDPDGTWPVVWESAKGVHVRDVEGRRYLDLTAAFGVAAAGHANPTVVRAGQRQMSRLLHAMGDVHPHALKGELARELSRLTFERWNGELKECCQPDDTDIEAGSLAQPRRGAHTISRTPSPRPSPPMLGEREESMLSSASGRIHGKTIFCSSGFEAVEAALKTARLATGRPHIIAFRGGYHGLGYGALNATHRDHFREPFRNQLGEFGLFAEFTASDADLRQSERELRRLFRKDKIGAVLVEPVQARGGINVPPAGFLPLLRDLCDRHGALLIVDEIYTGLGRTGKWFGVEHSGVVPDVVCLGKALTGGFPLSACVGRAEIMDAAWPVSNGEAIHTSTFLGHPVGCAMALAQISELRRRRLIGASARLGLELGYLLAGLASPSRRFLLRPRGLGLMAGLELVHRDRQPATAESLAIIKRMLRRGFVLLPEGEDANVISFTPPLTITGNQLASAVHALQAALNEVLAG